MHANAKKLLITIILIGLLSQVASNYSNVCAKSAASTDSISLSLTQVDSLIGTLDSQELELRLLRLQYRELQETSQLDSLIAAERLKVYKPNWWDRITRSPIVWFALGVYIGTRAVTSP